jgi:hypothetical protein
MELKNLLLCIREYSHSGIHRNMLLSEAFAGVWGDNWSDFLNGVKTAEVCPPSSPMFVLPSDYGPRPHPILVLMYYMAIA